MLTQAHLDALNHDPSPTVRADVTAAVAADFVAGRLTENETRIAEQILERLARDVEARVRQALADHVKECPFLPPDIAVTLARDLEDSIALPMIEHSPLLDDAELISLVRAGDTVRQLAVARRRILGEAVTDELVDTGKSAVVGVVLANTGADISDNALLKTAVRFRGNPAIETGLVERSMLPLTVCEILIESVSAELRDRLISKHQIPAFMANELVAQGRELAQTQILAPDGVESGARLAALLKERNLLTPTLVLRTLCIGDLRFFEGAMATLARISVSNAKLLLYDQGPGGLPGIYGKAGLPPSLFRAFRIGIGAVLEGQMKRGRAAYTRYIIDQLVFQYEDLSPAGLEHLLGELSHRTQLKEAPPFRVE